MRRRLNTKGFTLVELLIVMAIIGLLSIAAIAGGSYAIKQGRTSRKRKEVDQVATLLQAYYNEKLSYPAPETVKTNVDTLVSSTTKLGTYSEGYKFDNKPCTASGCYAYDTSDSNTKYALCTQLDPGTPASQYNTTSGTGAAQKLCYCIGGADALYVATCALTSRYN